MNDYKFQRDLVVEAQDRAVTRDSATIAEIVARLPALTFLVVADITSALDLPDPSLVYAWIDEGVLEAVNLGSVEGGRPYYKISRALFLEFLRKRTV